MSTLAPATRSQLALPCDNSMGNGMVDISSGLTVTSSSAVAV